MTRLSAPGAGAAGLTLRQPMVIYSRYELNRMLLARAEDAGAQIEQTRVLRLERAGERRPCAAGGQQPCRLG